MEMICRYRISGTIIDNVFIDRLMPDAPGEYLKVYLYLLRHQPEMPGISAIADALDHTEADVRRALRYWEQAGALVGDDRQQPAGESPGQAGNRQQEPEAKGVRLEDIWKTAEGSGGAVQAAGGGVWGASPAEDGVRAVPASGGGVWGASLAEDGSRAVPAASGQRQEYGEGAGGPASGKPEPPVYSQEQVNRLSGDEDFTQLLYIAQKYMNKAFTQRECQVFAYLYDGLHMSQELLEYLVEYCVQAGHTSIRYIETVGLNWHEKGLETVEEARAYSSGFTRDSFAVMRAFGLGDRRPGDTEKEMISRWFGTYGFTREVVLEACNRTLEATHSPSFRYADKILSEWKKAGVKSLKDVGALDKKRQGRRPAQKEKAKTNQFHNFEQRDTDYDSMVLDQVKSWIGGTGSR
ncbi:MAG: DnaD domain protein [Lachnospiraceae bacterium]|nr:DnaD domain protein [Lachnospiraceae bacterium]